MVAGYLQPDWQVHPRVRAFSTTRHSGVSQAPYDSFNLADHVGDVPQHVMQNRWQLQQALDLPSDPLWLHQIHGDTVVDASRSEPWPDADASYTTELGIVCAVLTADCLPILICDKAGTEVAAVHAGWQGLLAGVIPQTLASLSQAGENYVAWLGPGISRNAFIVKQDVYDKFAQATPSYEPSCFELAPGVWQIDLYQVARSQLQQAGITDIYGGNYCTYHDPAQFFSYRRSKFTGRMASLIWLQP